MTKPLTSQEILTKAIAKAIDGGWSTSLEVCDGAGCLMHEDGGVWDPTEGTLLEHPNDIIFNHDFAKALWPEGTCTCGSTHQPASVLHVTSTGERHIGLNDWRYHLQQMVISPDPIKYLGEHLDV